MRHPARTEEYSQASADLRRRIQHQPGDASDVECWEAKSTEEPGGR